jgi:medium-chain acyl-[acyl-carrier-protein] hydrolase
LVVGARRAPHLPSSQSPLSGLPDPEFLQGLEARYGALPAAVRAEPELMRMILPVLRADFSALDRYVYRDEEPLPVRLVALGGRSDPTVEVRELRAWQEHTLAGFELHLLEGGHFFHREAKAALVERWARLLPG